MSEEQQPTALVNNELTERINKSYIASSFTLLNGGTDNLLMITANKEESSVDILVTYEALEQVLNDLKPEIKAAKQSNEQRVELSQDAEKSNEL